MSENETPKQEAKQETKPAGELPEAELDKVTGGSGVFDLILEGTTQGSVKGGPKAPTTPTDHIEHRRDSTGI